jgi:HAD superfamily hydrolase (TIGR01459 family)
MSLQLKTNLPSEILPGFRSLMDSYDTFIIDLWGVVHDGVKPLPGVIEHLEAMKAENKLVIFLTNAPRRMQSVADQLKRLGIHSDLYAYVYSSGENAFENLSQQKPLGPVFAAIAPMHQGLVYDLDLQVVDNIEKAAFILNTGPDPLHLEDHIPWLEKGAAQKISMVCVNPDVHVISGGELKLCAGSLAEYYESIGGNVTYHGKPYKAVYESLLKKFPEINVNRLMVIGDSLSTDILGGNNMGFDSSLVLTGVEMRPLDGEDPLCSLQKIKERINDKKIYPTYVIEGFKL